MTKTNVDLSELLAKHDQGPAADLYGCATRLRRSPNAGPPRTSVA
ncbi:hypothetical protein [Gemmobacter aquaticus]|nr:hypothetical protein [Gemmobacter aquaticus]